MTIGNKHPLTGNQTQTFRHVTLGQQTDISNPNVRLKRKRQSLAMEVLFVAYYDTIYSDETTVVDDDSENGVKPC